MTENELEKWLSENPEFDTQKESEPLINISSGKKQPEIPEIDLHGLILPRAFARLSQFIRSQPQTIQKIRIIHGKGLHSTSEQQGILREEVRKWLLKMKNKKELIKDFTYEKPQYGGWGVTLVWLLR